MVVFGNSEVVGDVEQVNRKPVSPLRQKMLDDLNLGGYAPSTKTTYIDAVIRIAKHTGVRPDKLSESEVRDYLLNMREVERVAKGTFQSNLYGLKFFYCNTLDRDWSLFTKKKWGYPGKSDYLFPLHVMIVPVL